MPTSAPSLLGWVFEKVEHLRPTSVLDIGIGFGKYGFLTKEYASVRHPASLSGCHLVGVEPFQSYITPLCRLIYDEIRIGDALHMDFSHDKFDLIIMADVIEHFEKPDGLRLLHDLKKVSKKLIITTPIVFSRQDACFGNDYEIHRSVWSIGDFPGTLIDTSQSGCIFGVELKGDLPD